MITIGVNAYMFIVTYKLSTTYGIFEKIKIVGDYKVLQNVGLCTWALAISIILLALMLNIIIKMFLIKRKIVYLLEEIPLE
jgi:hypothetical protein